MKTYTEINGLNLKQTAAALAMAYTNRDAMKPEARKDLDDRIAALEDRKRRLEATEKR
jgi:hypothetical protein